MFIYFYRLYDRYTREVVSLAVLGDERATWRPTTYTTERWGCSLRFSYPIAKLADYRARYAKLEASDNPFATVVLAHLAARDTRGRTSRWRLRRWTGASRRLIVRRWTRCSTALASSRPPMISSASNWRYPPISVTLQHAAIGAVNTI